LFDKYLLRWRRRRWLYRAVRKRRQLKPISNRTDTIRTDDILLCVTVRDEMLRLPYFLKYYRNLGVEHFLIIDNGSTDGTVNYLKDQRDVSIWRTKASYKRARFGVDWINWLLLRYARNHWVITVDVDEFFVYPFCDTRSLRALTDWLDSSDMPSFGAMMLDMYPKGSIDQVPYRSGQDPMEILSWFDAGNYSITRNPKFKNLWIQGGPRSRVFFSENPHQAPALNKLPLVKWDWRYAYESSTHMLLPRSLNVTYERNGGEVASGILLHTKFLPTFDGKVAEEMVRNQHYGNSKEYKTYHDGLQDNPEFWCKWSEKYINWRQLEILGLMSKGNWA
ncbi:MAG: glycosyltransferase family 2 protein, partial [Hyphomicrobiales bacterium]